MYPLFGSDQVDLVDAAKPVFWILIAILALFSYGATFFNSLVGAGGVYYALRIQTIAALLYMAMVYVVIQTGIGGVAGAWATEIVYWALLWWLSARGLSAKHWQGAQL